MYLYSLHFTLFTQYKVKKELIKIFSLRQQITIISFSSYTIIYTIFVNSILKVNCTLCVELRESSSYTKTAHTHYSNFLSQWGQQTEKCAAHHPLKLYNLLYTHIFLYIYTSTIYTIIYVIYTKSRAFIFYCNAT